MGKDGKKRMVLLVLSSTYDKAMATFMTANSALAMDMEVHIYFAFLGVGVVKKGFSPKLPGIFRFVTGLYKKRLRKTGIGDLESQIATAQKLGARMYVCSLCIKANLLKKEKLREGVKPAGFATLVDLMDESDIYMVIS
ncbi:MAG: DsrE/DsrF/DrsH-like family protein [Thermoplasmata archaeon]|nr:MAG: DsrE/DsrF/DrsH-like family protein [Thermoplasmata archaeon]